MSSRTTQATKRHEQQIGELIAFTRQQQHTIDALQEQLAELTLRTTYLLRHIPVRNHKAGILDPSTGKPATELTTMYAVYLEQRDEFADRLAREAEGEDVAPTVEVRRSTEQVAIV